MRYWRKLKMDSNRFRICFNENNIQLENVVKETEKPRLQLTANEKNQFVLQTKDEQLLEGFDATIIRCILDINNFKIKHQDKNKIFEICRAIAEQTIDLAMYLKTEPNDYGRFGFVKTYITKQIDSASTRKLREKKLKAMSNYVAPEERAIGIKWKSKKKPTIDLPDHLFVQNKFYYVSIIKTLESIFSSSQFVEMFLNHNNSHECEPGIYKYFCCGETHTKFDVFRNKTTVHIQIGINEFEPCCALKSKTGTNKICGIYLQIRNLPIEYLSKLNCIFLVALCKTQDMKSNDGYFDNIAHCIVSDLKNLETGGFLVKNKGFFKAALTNLCFDNAGGKMVLGFRESFNSDYYCSICECNKKECRAEVKELPQKLRSKLSYEHLFSQLGENEVIDYSVSKGVQRFCLFNELTYFNIFENLYVDLMHDVFEGLIISFTEKFFEYCSKNRIISKGKIMQMIRDFNYSSTESSSSIVTYTRSHFNQSATQLHCLMVHLPFIFYEYRERLKDVWPIMESLLRCIQIVCSQEIQEGDIKTLENQIANYLNGMKNVFKYQLKPKDHFFTHYPTVIRKQGPVKPMSMLRFESKHKYFTDIAKRTLNFVNLPKTMAENHQLNILFNGFIASKTEPSKLGTKQLKCCAEFDTIRESILNRVGNEIDSVFRINFFTFNSIRYSKGLMLTDGISFFEIKLILKHIENYYLICHKYSVVKFSNQCNSVIIKKDEPNNEDIIDFISLKYKNTYEKLVLGAEVHIIADTLDVYRNL